MKTLKVGDLHVKPNNLKESEELMQFILHSANSCIVDRVEFLGDLLDTHDIVRLSVLKFWTKWFHILSKQSFKVVILIGNHDLSGDYSDTFSALHTALHLENKNFK